MPRIEAEQLLVRETGEQLAVNLSDLDRLPPTIRNIMLEGKLDLSSVVRTDKDRVDEAAIAFSCDLLTAAATCDILRSHDRAAKVFPSRVYRKRAKAWEKLAGNLVLTLVVDEQVILNPAVFASALVKAKPLSAKRVVKGGV